MKTTLTTAFIAIFMAIMSKNMMAQEKYAVLLCGYGPEIWNCVPSQSTESAFWNDTYLMWEALIDKGFKDEHIFV